MDVLGKTYPDAEERVARLASLRDIYLRTHGLSGRGPRGRQTRSSEVRRLARRHAPFVSRGCASWEWIVTPSRLRSVCSTDIKAGVFEPETPLDKASGTIERHVKASEGLETYLVLQAYSEETSADGSELAGKPAKTSRKSGSGKTSKSSHDDAEEETAKS